MRRPFTFCVVAMVSSIFQQSLEQGCEDDLHSAAIDFPAINFNSNFNHSNSPHPVPLPP